MIDEVDAKVDWCLEGYAEEALVFSISLPLKTSQIADILQDPKPWGGLTPISADLASEIVARFDLSVNTSHCDSFAIGDFSK